MPRYRDIAALYKPHGEALRHPLGLCVLPDAAGDQQPHVHGRRAGASRTTSPASARPAAACRATASRTCRPACWRRCSISSPIPASASTDPVATRTRENQDDIIKISLALRRPVRFSDLTNRWAADSNYARSMECVATRFREAYCTPASEPQETAGTWRSETKAPSPAGAARRAAAHPATAGLAMRVSGRPATAARLRC